MMGRVDDGSYSAAVVGVLITEFDELRRPETATIVRAAIARHATDPSASFEVILDAVSANWRLRADLATSGRVRLGCFRLSQNDADRDREQRINDLLAQISV